MSLISITNHWFGAFYNFLTVYLVYNVGCNPANIHLFKVNNRNSKICSELTNFSSFFIVDVEQVNVCWEYVEQQNFKSVSLMQNRFNSHDP